jgi:hypothetical protein
LLIAAAEWWQERNGVWPGPVVFAALKQASTGERYSRCDVGALARSRSRATVPALRRCPMGESDANYVAASSGPIEVVVQ